MTITRKKPIAKRRTTPRRFKTPRCDIRGCKKPQDVTWTERVFVGIDNVGHTWDRWEEKAHGMCKSHATAEADRRFSRFIRDRDKECRIPTEKGCVGPLQCCHLLSRRFRTTRWDECNAVAGCAGHHAYWTVNPDRWAAFLDEHQRDLLSDSATVADLRARAFNGEPMDLAEVLARYPK